MSCKKSSEVILNWALLEDNGIGLGCIEGSFTVSCGNFQKREDPNIDPKVL